MNFQERCVNMGAVERRKGRGKLCDYILLKFRRRVSEDCEQDWGIL